MMHKRSTSHLMLALSTGALLSAIACPALAERGFPSVVQDATGLACAPGCGLCHVDPAGGGPRNAFGLHLNRDLRVTSEGSLREAIACMRDGSCQVNDSDGDGVNDIQELLAGTNPSKAGNSNLCGPTYGCGARVEPKSPLDADAAAIVALGAGALWFVQRRARRQ